MKYKNALALCLFFCVYKLQVTACICYQPIGFDLVEYDQSENIIEILIKDKISKSAENLGNNIETISEEGEYLDFNAHIAHVFKGELTIGDLYLRTTDLESNCQ